MNIFKKKKKPSDFKKGEVYKMKVASRSHVKSPYYVIIKNVGEGYIQTDIPEHRSFIIKYPSDEWDYHIPRMKLIGNDEASRKLIYKQTNLV